MRNIIVRLRWNDTVMLAEIKEFKVSTQKFIIGIIKLFARLELSQICKYFDLSVLFELERNLLTKHIYQTNKQSIKVMLSAC